MAGQLTISTLKSDSGVLATQNGMTGIAKAWVNWNGSGGATIRASFNVSSVTRTAQGKYSVAFSTAMPDANYATVSNCSNDFADSTGDVFVKQISQTTSSVGLRINDTGGTAIDAAVIATAIFSA